MPRVIATRAGRVGEHLGTLGTYRICTVTKLNCIVVGLRHLPTIQPRDLWCRRKQRLWFWEHSAVEFVEAPSYLPRQFQMTSLILSHRHVMRAVENDIRGLQYRITEETKRSEVLVVEWRICSL